MKSIENFVNSNFKEFINLGNSEVCEFKDLNEFDSEFILLIKL
jgi:hypothetical protein